MVETGVRAAEIISRYADRSARQCGVCAKGTAAIRDVFAGLRDGTASAKDRDNLERCAFLDGKVYTSAGALVEGLEHLGAKKVSAITPYMKPLTRTVCEYIEAEGVEVQDAASPEVSDNLAVGRLDPADLDDIAAKIDTSGADALVPSARVQMPSLPVVQRIQTRSTSRW